MPYAIRTPIAFAFVVAAVAFSVTATYYADRQPAGLVIVCEAGSFETREDAADPYLRAAADCSVATSHGPAATVLLID